MGTSPEDKVQVGLRKPPNTTHTEVTLLPLPSALLPSHPYTPKLGFSVYLLPEDFSTNPSNVPWLIHFPPVLPAFPEIELQALIITVRSGLDSW